MEAIDKETLEMSKLMFKETITDEEAMRYGHWMHKQTRQFMSGEVVSNLQEQLDKLNANIK